MQSSSQLQSDLRQDLCRLASFGANIADAHSCFILLPSDIFNAQPSPIPSPGTSAEGFTPGKPLPASTETPVAVELFGVHSLSNDIVAQPRLSAESGLIGWVARHNRSIHVSPFERDSRTLGIYTKDQNLKSFIGIPVALELQENAQENASSSLAGGQVGVIACDSKKSFAFSKLQGKLLEDLAREVASTVRLRVRAAGTQNTKQAWPGFLEKAEQAASAIGLNSVEVMRVQVHDFSDFEMYYGSQVAINRIHRMYRLFDQLLPEHAPSIRLPDGSFIAILDSMMGAYYENRMKATCDHVFSRGANAGSKAPGAAGPNVEFRRLSFRDRGCRGFSLAQLIAASAKKFPFNENLKDDSNYEYRRA